MFLVIKYDSVFNCLFLILIFMPETKATDIITEKYFIKSVHLNREVFVDCYYPSNFEEVA
jgi:hypothetical protein